MLNARVAKAQARITEVGSFERRRIYGQSNLRTFRDGTRVLVTIIRERLNASPARIVGGPVRSASGAGDRA